MLRSLVRYRARTSLTHGQHLRKAPTVLEELAHTIFCEAHKKMSAVHPGLGISEGSINKITHRSRA